MSVAILLVVAAASSPRGVLAFAPPAPTRLAAATSLAMSGRNELYPGPSNYSPYDDREWADWDDAAPFDAPPPPLRYRRPSSAGGLPPTQPRSASSASGAGERPFSRSNDRYWASGQYSQPIDTRPQSAWQNNAQKEYRESKFQREGQWPQKQVYRGYNKPSADGPVGSRSSFGAGYGGNQRREERLDRMGNGLGISQPASGLTATGAGRTRRRDNEGYNDVGRAQEGRTEDFRSRSSSRTSPSQDKLPTLRGEEVGFGRRDSSFDVTAAATQGTGFGDESDYLDRMREEQRQLQRQMRREEGWERQSRGRRMGTANIDFGGDRFDSFNERGESRGMLEDLSGPRGYIPPPMAPPPLPPPPIEDRRQGRRGANAGEGDTPAFRRGSKSGGYGNAPKYGDRLAGGSATQGWPPKPEVYETDLRPGDYGRRMDGGPPSSLTEMRREPPPLLPRDGDFGRFASGAGYQYYGDRRQPPAKPRTPQAELNEFGREAGGRFYRYYSRETTPPSQRGMNNRPESATKPRYAQPRPPPPEVEEFRDDFEDADDYSRGRRGTRADSMSYDEPRPGIRGGVDEGWGKFDRRSSQERADAAFDRRRQMTQASFGDARSDSGERRPVEPPSFGRKRLEQDSFVERYEDGEKMLEENWSSQQRADRSFDRRRTRSQQSFGQRPPPPRFGEEVGGFEENVSSQQRADRSFDRRRAVSQQSFGDARDGDFEQRRAPRPEEEPWEEPYESKLLSRVQQYPPAGRAGGSGGKEKANSGQNLVDGIKKMADKILSPYAEDGSAFAVDRMMNRVQTDIDKSIADEKRTIKALLADARSCLLADPTVRDMLGGAVTLGKPLSKSASSTMVNDVTKSRLQLVLPIFGSEGEGRLRLEANQDEIERLELEAEGRVIDVRLGRPGDAMDVDVYTFPNSEGQ